MEPKKLTVDKLKEICNFLLKGMNEKESCILASFPYADYLIAKKDETIRLLIEQTNVKFKLTHIEQIEKTKSDKNSMYLLEKLRPEEFGPKSKGDTAPTINIISAIIKDIQNDPEQSIIVQNRNARIEDAEPKVLEGADILV